MTFSFSKVGCSFLVCCFWLAPLDVSDIVLSCFCVFWCIYRISRSENHPFFIVVLIWSASQWITLACGLKTSTFLPDLYHSFPISSSRAHVLRFGLWSLWFLTSSFMYLKREQPTFAAWRSVLPCWLLREHLLIMTPKPVAWVPRFVILWLDIFIMGGILWLYQTQRLFMICAPDTDVTENSHGGCSWTAGHKKKKKKINVYITLSFNLVKVCCPAILYFTSRTKTLNYFQVFLSHLWFISTVLFLD